MRFRDGLKSKKEQEYTVKKKVGGVLSDTNLQRLDIYMYIYVYICIYIYIYIYAYIFTHIHI